MKIKHILVIDDSQDACEGIKKACDKLNLQCTIFGEPLYSEKGPVKEVEELIAGKKIDLALLDYKLWGNMTGESFCELLNTKKIPFIGFSSSGLHNILLQKRGAFLLGSKPSQVWDEDVMTTYLNETISRLLEMK